MTEATTTAPQTADAPAIVYECGITLHPLHYDIFWVLEAAEHPVVSPAKRRLTAEGQFVLSPQDAAELIFAFADPAAAVDAAAACDDGARLSRFSREAFAFARRHGVLPAEGAKIVADIMQLVDRGMSAPNGK